MVVDGSLIEREGVIKAMNVRILANAVGCAVFIASNATPT